MSDKKRTINTTTSSTEVTLIDGNIGSYDRVEWVNGGSSGATPLNATNLNRMDEAIAKLYGPTGLVHTIVDTINAEIEARQTDINTLDKDLTSEEEARLAADNDLKDAFEAGDKTLEDAITGENGLNSRIEQLETTVGDEESGLVEKVNSLNSIVTGDDNNPGGLVSDVKDLQASVGDTESGLLKDVEDLKNELNTSESGLKDRVEELESKIDGTDSEDGLINDVNDLKETIYRETEGLEDKVEALTKDVEDLKNSSGGGSDVDLSGYVKTTDELILNCGTSTVNIFTK